MKAAGLEPRYGIIGTDISREAIFQARRGIYRESKMAMVDKAYKQYLFRSSWQRVMASKSRAAPPCMFSDEQYTNRWIASYKAQNASDLLPEYVGLFSSLEAQRDY